MAKAQATETFWNSLRVAIVEVIEQRTKRKDIEDSTYTAKVYRLDSVTPCRVDIRPTKK